MNFEPASYIEVVISQPRPKPSITALLQAYFDVGVEECACCGKVKYQETNRVYVLPRYISIWF
jgi:hypothetical protein